MSTQVTQVKYGRDGLEIGLFFFVFVLFCFVSLMPARSADQLPNSYQKQIHIFDLYPRQSL